jgi:cell division protein FtsN
MADSDSFNEYDEDEQDDGFLTFDARDEEEDRSRGPLVIAAIVAVLLICGVILWQLYEGNREGGETPQIAADTGSFKAAPADTGGTQTDDLDKGVFDAADGTGAPPLDVQPSTAGAEDPLLGDGAAVPATTPAAQVPAATRPAPTVPAPAPRREATAVAPAPKPVAKPAPKPAPVKVAAATPAPRPATTPVTAPAPKVAVASVDRPAPTQVAVSPTPAPAPKTAPVRTTGIAAQLGSFQTRASADTALARYRASGLSGPVSVVAADLGAKGTWYRIRATGFDTRSEVDSFCSKARSAGAQCIPSGR